MTQRVYPVISNGDGYIASDCAFSCEEDAKQEAARLTALARMRCNGEYEPVGYSVSEYDLAPAGWLTPETWTGKPVPEEVPTFVDFPREAEVGEHFTKSATGLSTFALDSEGTTGSTGE